MATILITGTSGFIGQALAEELKTQHDVVCLSRKETNVNDVVTLQGDFTQAAVLAQLDDYAIDVVVHLAAVTGGCSEEDGLRVNVQGTHGLIRYLVDRGCRKFIMASSIALIGVQNILFRPLQVPVPDEHPCLDRDGYGWSKYLMEEVTRYFVRQNPDLDVINIRLASIMSEDTCPEPVKATDPLGPWALARLSQMYLSDAIDCFVRAVESSYKPGVRMLNAVAATACAADPVPDILRAWWGKDAEGLDLSHYARSGHERDAVYDIRRIADEIGFTPRRNTI